MATAVADHELTIADVLERLGGIDPRRLRLRPPPGTASERDLVRQKRHANRRLAELVDGTLVDKAMGFPEAGNSVTLLVALATFVKEHKLGLVATNDDYMRLRRGLVRVPDISFTSKARLKPGWNKKQIADFAPDLAIEYLSPDNTRAEMARKRREYFAAGTRLVWEIHVRRKYVDVYTAPEVKKRLTERQTLTGGDVLPGFSYSIRDVFASPLA